LGLGLGLGLGDPRVTQGPPKRHARVTQASIYGSAFVFNKNGKKAGVGQEKIAKIAEIAKDRRNQEPKPTADEHGLSRILIDGSGLLA
jgi:hypothetical protein